MENITIKINGVEVSAPAGSTIWKLPDWHILTSLHFAI